MRSIFSPYTQAWKPARSASFTIARKSHHREAHIPVRAGNASGQVVFSTVPLPEKASPCRVHGRRARRGDRALAACHRSPRCWLDRLMRCRKRCSRSSSAKSALLPRAVRPCSHVSLGRHCRRCRQRLAGEARKHQRFACAISIHEGRGTVWCKTRKSLVETLGHGVSSTAPDWVI